MKNIQFLFILLLLSSQNLKGQNLQGRDLCKDVYVWDFKDRENKTSKILKEMANEVESALTQCPECVVLERRNFGDVSSQIETEKEIQKSDYARISNELKNAFGAKAAKIVIFGYFNNNESLSDVQLELRFVSLNDKQLLLVKSLTLSREIAFSNAIKRKEAIKGFILYDVLQMIKLPTPIPIAMAAVTIPASGVQNTWGIIGLVGGVGTVTGLILQSQAKQAWEKTWTADPYDMKGEYAAKNDTYKGKQTITYVSGAVTTLCAIMYIIKKCNRDKALRQTSEREKAIAQPRGLSSAPVPRKRQIKIDVVTGTQIGLVVNF